MFNHEHVSPTILEYANLSDDDPRKELMESVSHLITGQGFLQEYQMACEKYMKQC